METPHSGAVQPRSTIKFPIYNEDCSLQIHQLVADSSLTSDLYSEEFDTIETNIAGSGPEFDVNTANSDVESLNYLDSQKSTPWIGRPIPIVYPTTRRSLWHVVRHLKSEDKMWSSFQNKHDFELTQQFIKANVSKDHMDIYFKNQLGPEGSSFSSAYQLLEAIDELE